MTAPPIPYRLFEVVGVEMEYMIVDSGDLSVKPLTGEVIREAAGSYASDYEQEDVTWSNELVLHVMEIKMTSPSSSPGKAVGPLQRDVERINGILDKYNARLMPTGAHPWMDPARETVLWPWEYREVYETYDRIFGCRRHGWANLQSIHVNLPFSGDGEFGRLSAAVRLLLPIIPALAASSPILGLSRGALDARLAAYITNSAIVPSMTGEIIPEPVYTREDYEKLVFGRMYSEIAQYDPDGTLCHEWLNSRGAIARFDRSALEIRLMDSQESVTADMAVSAAVFNAARAILDETWLDYGRQKAWETGPLKKILLDTIKDAHGAVIGDPAYLRAFGMDGGRKTTAGEVWEKIIGVTSGLYPLDEIFKKPIGNILERGPLAARIMKSLGGDLRKESVREVYRRLCGCLAQGAVFTE